MINTKFISSYVGEGLGWDAENQAGASGNVLVIGLNGTWKGISLWFIHNA